MSETYTGNKGMRTLFASLIANEDGVTAIEYGVLAALVAFAATAGFTSLGSAINQKFADIATKLTGTAIVSP
ncbi:Flp family type IVb pilin [Azospirillum argentinense]|nr:Flp family type IVb pilin [Azospirillum argentinense]